MDKQSKWFAVVLLVIGGMVTQGFAFFYDYIKPYVLDQENPLTSKVAELNVVGKELVLEQKNLNSHLQALAEKASDHPEINIQITEVVNRVNNIVQTAIKYETYAREAGDLIGAADKQLTNSKFNTGADLVLGLGQGATVCGNENSLGVTRESGLSASIYIDGDLRTASVGEEFYFTSPEGASMVSFLGKEGGFFKFRVSCNISKNRA